MAGMVLLGALFGGAMWLEQETSAGATVRAVVVGPAPLSVAVDERSGHAFVLSRSTDSPDAASVSMIDTVTGALLRPQTVGRVPQALAVDDRDAHVLVANADNTIRVLDAQNGVVLHTGHVQSASTGTTMIATSGSYIRLRVHTRQLRSVVKSVQALYGSSRRAATRCTGQARAIIASTTRCNAPLSTVESDSERRSVSSGVNA
jgi:hypothetical protein